MGWTTADSRWGFGGSGGVVFSRAKGWRDRQAGSIVARVRGLPGEVELQDDLRGDRRPYAAESSHITARGNLFWANRDSTDFPENPLRGRGGALSFLTLRAFISVRRCTSA